MKRNKDKPHILFRNETVGIFIIIAIFYSPLFIAKAVSVVFGIDPHTCLKGAVLVYCIAFVVGLAKIDECHFYF